MFVLLAPYELLFLDVRKSALSVVVV